MFCYKKNIEKYRIEKSIFSYIVSAEKNRFLAKSDRDRLGLQIPRSAVSACQACWTTMVVGLTFDLYVPGKISPLRH